MLQLKRHSDRLVNNNNKKANDMLCIRGPLRAKDTHRMKVRVKKIYFM